MSVVTQESFQEKRKEKEISKLQMLKTLPPQLVSANLSPSAPLERIVALLNAAERSLPAECESPLILFISPAKGEGSDTIAFDTACAAAHTGRRVLFIDTGSSAAMAARLRCKAAPSLLSFLKSDNDNRSPLLTVKGTSLYFASLSDLKEPEKFAPDARSCKYILGELRSIFDMVVIYLESGLTSPLAAMLCQHADGSIIVAEAERTRLPVIKTLRRSMESHEARIAGAVLNRRRFYIPRMIYSALFRSSS